MRNADDFYMKLFKGSGPAVPGWVFKRWKVKDLESIPYFDGRTLKSLAGTFKRGRTGTDNVVAEMLDALELDVWESVACAFKLQILNHNSCDNDDSWRTFVINLVPKLRRPKVRACTSAGVIRPRG